MAICEKCIKKSVCKLCDGTEIMGCIEFVSLNKVIMNGQPLPDDCEVLTKEAYADLCIRASKCPEPNCLEIPTGSTAKIDVPDNNVGDIDCISRKAVLDAIDSKAWEFCDYLISKGRNDEQKPVSHFADNLRECVSEDLPSVTPQLSSALEKNSKKLENPTAKNELGVDCIVDVLGSYTDLDIPYKREIAENILTKLSSVTPIRPKGHWIVAKGGSYLGMRNACCSNCKDFYTNDWNVMNFCPNCSADMRKVEE